MPRKVGGRCADSLGGLPGAAGTELDEDRLVKDYLVGGAFHAGGKRSSPAAREALPVAAAVALVVGAAVGCCLFRASGGLKPCRPHRLRPTSYTELLTTE
jgi:hypothetical protein